MIESEPESEPLEERKEDLLFIADDTPQNLQVLAKYLSGEKYGIAFATNGKQALHLIRETQPDLVLLDVMMPEMNGFDVCRELKKSPDTREIPVIFLTAKTETEDIVEGFEAGGIDYITKPFRSAELLARVRTQLELKKSKEKLIRLNRKLEKELSDAADYVHSLLPRPRITGEKPLTDWRFIPSIHLGGDILGYQWLDDENFGFYLLDVCGHGVSTALLSVSIQKLLHRVMINCNNKNNPAEVLRDVNEDFLRCNPEFMFFTIWYGVYQRSNHRLIYSSAGHPPAILVTGSNPRDAQVLELRTPGVLVGVLPEAEFINKEVELQEYNELYVYSDGGYEVKKKSDGRMWTLQEWVELLEHTARTNNGSLDSIVEYVRQIQGSHQFEDDFTLLKINF